MSSWDKYIDYASLKVEVAGIPFGTSVHINFVNLFLDIMPLLL